MNNFLYVVELIVKVLFTISAALVSFFLIASLGYFIVTNLSIIVTVLAFIVVICLGFELIRWIWSGSLFKKG